MAKEVQSTSQRVSQTLPKGALVEALHTFPLSLEQERILDEAKEEIEHHPPLRKFAQRAHPWGLIALAAATGFLLAFLGKVRR